MLMQASDENGIVGNDDTGMLRGGGWS
jgi:hypothetical protein